MKSGRNSVRNITRVMGAPDEKYVEADCVIMIYYYPKARLAHKERSQKKRRKRKKGIEKGVQPQPE